jgi:UBX domain-containing protein 1
VATTASSAPRRPLVVDDTQPMTSVQIRLHDGTRLVAKFNHTHTVGDLRGFVDAALPKRVAYQLQTTLPVRVLADESQTLQEAGLLGSTVVQRPL